MKLALVLAATMFSVPVTDPVPADPRPTPSAGQVLDGWDAKRADAWASGDVRRLRGLYLPGSVAGERDVAMLRRWLDRGLVVTGFDMQVLSLREVSHTADRMVLAVVDRVVGGTASGLALPADLPSARTLVLRRVDGEWRMASVAVSGRGA